MCLAWLPAAQPAGPSWDLSCGQIFHTPPPSTPARMHLLPSQTQSPGLWVPVRPPTPLLYKVGGDVWPRFVCLLLFFAHHCSTDPVCLNPLDVTLMDCRDGVHGGWICVWLDEGGASDGKCWAREAAEQRERKGGSVIFSCRRVAGSKLIWCCYVTVIIILYNHISSFV